jgi:hypothetical protein
MRGLNRVGEHVLADAVASGVLLLADTREADQANCMQLELGDPRQFAFSLTPKGRDALHPEGA